MELKKLINKIKLIKNKLNQIKSNLNNKTQRKRKMKVKKIPNPIKIIIRKKEHKKNIASFFFVPNLYLLRNTIPIE